MNAPATNDIPSSWVRRLTVNDVSRMIEAGILAEDDRVELLDGMLVAVSPQSEDHALVVERLNRLLVRALTDEFRVRPQLPLMLGETWLPEPDLAVVREPADARTPRRPASALLIVEVALDSLQKDRGVKRALYARAGIGEYVIVDVSQRRLELYRDPDPASGTYRRTSVAGLGERVRLESVDLEMAVDDLLG